MIIVKCGDIECKWQDEVTASDVYNYFGAVGRLEMENSTFRTVNGEDKLPEGTYNLNIFWEDELKEEEEEDTEINDEDEIICRVCRDSDQTEPLYHPCHCRGSIRWVHEKCLLTWIARSKSMKCELCNKEFTFTKVYCQDAPPSIGFLHVLMYMLGTGAKFVAMILRVVLACVFWLIILPMFTSKLNQLMTSPWSSNEFFFQPFSWRDVVYDLWHGTLLLSIMLIFFCCVSFWKDWCRGNVNDFPELQDAMLFLSNAEVHLRVVLSLKSKSTANSNTMRSTSTHHTNDRPTTTINEPVVNVDRTEAPSVNISTPHSPVPRRPTRPSNKHSSKKSYPTTNVTTINHTGRTVNGREFGHVVDILLERARQNRIRNTPHEHFTMGRLLLGETDQEPDISIWELIGFQGRFQVFTTTATTLPIIVSALLVSAVLVPLCLGQVVVYFAQMLTYFFGYNLATLDSITLRFIGCALLFVAVRSFFYILSKANNYLTFHKLRTYFSEHSVAHIVYIMALLTIAKFYLYGFAKIVFNVFLNLICIPYITGGLLTGVLFPFFDESDYEESPITIISKFVLFIDYNWLGLCYWVLGLVYIICLSYSVSVLQSMLRPEVLWFFRHPEDINFNLIREMVKTSVSRRILQCLRGQFIFVLLMITLIRVPLNITKSLLPSYFPLSLYPAEPVIESVVDIVMLNAFLIFADKFRFSMTEFLKSLFGSFLHTIGFRLLLHSYLFGTVQPPDLEEDSSDSEDEEYEVDNEPRRDNQQIIHQTNNTTPENTETAPILSSNTEENTKTQIKEEKENTNITVENQPQPPTSSTANTTPTENISLEDDIDNWVRHVDQHGNVIYYPPHFEIRLSFLLALAWGVLALLITVTFVIPLLIGKELLTGLTNLVWWVDELPSEQTQPDVYSYFLGLYVFMGLIGSALMAIKSSREKWKAYRRQARLARRMARVIPSSISSISPLTPTPSFQEHDDSPDDIENFTSISPYIPVDERDDSHLVNESSSSVNVEQEMVQDKSSPSLTETIDVDANEQNENSELEETKEENGETIRRIYAQELEILEKKLRELNSLNENKDIHIKELLAIFGSEKGEPAQKLDSATPTDNVSMDPKPNLITKIVKFIVISAQRIYKFLKIIIAIVFMLLFIPYAVGISMELCLSTPVRISITDQCPYFPLLETWIIGMVYFKIWIRVTIIAPYLFTTPWHQYWTSIMQAGLFNMNPDFIISHVVFPIMSLIVCFLCVPYFIFKVVMTDIFEISPEVASMLHHLTYPFLLISFLVIRGAMRILSYMPIALESLYSRVHDERYLQSIQLQNYHESNPTS